MPDFCADNKETITAVNYNDSFPAAKSCLPNGTGFSSVPDTGIVPAAALKAQITALLGQAKAVAPTELRPEQTNPAETFAKNAATLRNNIRMEYCFYYKRYMYILADLLDSATKLRTGPYPEIYLQKKTNTATINSKLNQILQMLQALISIRNTELNQYYGERTGVNQLNDDLDTVRSKLVMDAKALKNAKLETDVQSAMVDYTVEKNASSRNLLAIYGFMNIVAGGLIFYLYRSANV